MMRYLLSFEFALIALLVTSAFTPATGQSKRRIQEKLDSCHTDELRVKVLHQAANSYILKIAEHKSDLDSATLLITTASKIAKKIKNDSLVFRSEYLRLMTLLEYKQFDTASRVVSALVQTTRDLILQASAWEIYGRYLRTFEPKVKALKTASSLYDSLRLYENVLACDRIIAEEYKHANRLPEAEAMLIDLVKRAKKIQSPRIHAIYSSLSKINIEKGNYHIALSYAMDALQAMEQSKTYDARYQRYRDMAIAYESLGERSLALHWHVKAFEEAKAKKPQYVYTDFSNMISLMIDEGQSQAALEIVQKTESDFPPTSELFFEPIAISYANCYNALGQYALAEKYYLKASRELVNADKTPLNKKTIAQFYVDRKRFEEARPYAQALIAIPSSSVRNPEEYNQGYYLLYRIDSAKGRYFDAMKNLARFKALTDSIHTRQKTQQAQELQVRFDMAQKEQSIQLLTKERELQERQLKSATVIRNGTFVGIGLLLIILGLVLNQYRIRQRVNKKINAKNELLQSLVREKEWLLKEVHHRVKNNLQTIVSLLESQTHYTQSSEALSAITDSQNRVNAMSIIHQKLFQTKNLTEISVQSYLPELILNLKESLSKGDIQFHTSIHPLDLDVTQAIPIGLIVNEAITNCIKYAFPESHAEPRIWTELTVDKANTVQLLIRDNGRGLPENFDIDSDDCGLGIKLMKGLAADIDGTFELLSTYTGLTIQIRFTAIVPLGRVYG